MNPKEEIPFTVQPQPDPEKDPNSPALWDLVINDMRARDRFGEGKYKTRLKPNNGRDFLVDLYQELLDACVYVRGLIYKATGR